MERDILYTDEEGYTPSRLARFFVFNPTLSRSEQDTELKVLFYHPPSVPVFDQAQSVGLVEGLYHFAAGFAPGENTNGLFTDKHKLAFHKPEDNFYLVLMVENPSLQTKEALTSRERELEMSLLQQITENCYETLHLLYGTLHSTMERLGPDGLRKLLAQFMQRYLTCLDFSRLDILTTLDGIQFMGVDRNVYLAVQCFVDGVESTFPELEGVAVFFHDRMLTSSLEPSDLRILYRYLFRFNSLERIVQSTPGFVALYHRNALIHVSNGREMQLLVFKMEELSLVFLLKKFESPHGASELQAYVTLRVKKLLAALQFHWERSLVSKSDDFLYLYYNHSNWAVKASLAGKKVPRSALHMISSVHSDFESQRHKPSDVVIRTFEGLWILAKKVDQRELYVILEGVDNLEEVEVKAMELSAALFGSILL